MEPEDKPVRNPELQQLLTAARRHESALAITIDVGDRIAGLVAAARLRQALLRTTAASDDLAARTPAIREALVAELHEATRSMYALLQRAPIHPGTRDLQRFTRWLLSRSTSALDGPHLFELDAAGKDLSGARFLGVHALRCGFITAMPHARIEDSFFDRTDFTHANLWRSAWHRTRVHRSHFKEASLASATFDRTTFLDCDLRGVELSVEEGCSQGPGRLQFIRCDLRGSRWHGRDVSRVKWLDCKLYGVTGVDLTSRLHITQGDVSAAGDGSGVLHQEVPPGARMVGRLMQAPAGDQPTGALR